MTAAERGILLLCCGLGDPEARPMTMAQFRELSRRASSAGIGAGDPASQVCAADLRRLGYDRDGAERVERLLNREERLERYLSAAERQNIFPLTRLGRDYPEMLIRKRGMSCPPCFFYAGNPMLFNRSCVGLVGSRKLGAEGAAFARRVGELAASEKLVLVTGGAEGADSVALYACLQHGGDAVLFVPDMLTGRAEQAGEHCLLCSENGYDLPFTAARALTRNAYIHMMGERTLVAQVGDGVGGSWSGAIENLKHGWSMLFVYDDGSTGALSLIERGATPVKHLERLALLTPAQTSLFG